MNIADVRLKLAAIVSILSIVASAYLVWIWLMTSVVTPLDRHVRDVDSIRALVENFRGDMRRMMETLTLRMVTSEINQTYEEKYSREDSLALNQRVLEQGQLSTVDYIAMEGRIRQQKSQITAIERRIRELEGERLRLEGQRGGSPPP